MADYGVLSTGFSRPRLADILEEIQDAFRTAFGDAINLTETSPLGQLAAILAAREDTLWEKMEDIYNSMDPDSAEDEAQDRLYRLNDAERKAASYSTVTATVTGDEGTVIDGPPNPFGASVDGDSTALFEALAEHTIGPTGTVEVAMQAHDTGPVLAPAGTLTTIATPKSGITSVTNAADAMPGQDTETSEAFRQRRLRSLRRTGSGTLNGIISAVDAVTGVTLTGGAENEFDTTDENGLPPHSVEIYVTGGDDTDIAEAIASSVGGGIETHGDTEVTVEDSEGVEQVICFSRPTTVPIYIIANVTANTDSREGAVYPSDGDTRLADALEEFGTDNAALGEDVVPFQLAAGAAASVAGINNMTLLVGISDPPISGAVLTMAPNEIPQYDASRITVVRD